MFEFAHAGEILIEPIAIPRADSALERFGLFGHSIQNALAQLQAPFLRLDFFFAALNEKTFEDLGSFFFARDQHAGTGPREASNTLLDIHAKIK